MQEGAKPRVKGKWYSRNFSIPTTPITDILMKYGVCILILLLFLSCQRGEKAIRLEQQFQYLFEQGLFNGAIVVIENDSVILSEGYGYADFEAQIPFQTNTPMDTGSITKTFTALAMVMLADFEEIDLDTPVVKFIEDFPYPTITLRHLLEQTSGIVSDDYVFERADKGIPLTNQTFLDFLFADKPDLKFIPGSQFMYNGFNHRLLAIIIEKISDVSFQEFIDTHIAKPLDFKDWFLRPVRLHDFPNTTALGYANAGDIQVVYNSDDFEAFYGDCNLFFSAEDLTKWSRSFLTGSLYQEAQLIQFLDTKSPFSELNILHWYSLASHRKYHFTGDWKGFYTMVYFDIDKQRSIVYLSNVYLAHWLRPAIVRNINLFLDGEFVPGWEQPLPLELVNEEITGVYQMKNDQFFEIRLENGELTLNTPDQSIDLYKLDTSFYYAPGIDLWIWFSKDQKEPLHIHCSSIYEQIEGSKNNIQAG